MNSISKLFYLNLIPFPYTWNITDNPKCKISQRWPPYECLAKPSLQKDSVVQKRRGISTQTDMENILIPALPLSCCVTWAQRHLSFSTPNCKMGNNCLKKPWGLSERESVKAPDLLQALKSQNEQSPLVSNTQDIENAIIQLGVSFSFVRHRSF